MQGPIGLPGTDGATGATGSAGVIGTRGATGATGSEGTTGTDGVTGASGSDGTTGTDGVTGASGSDGTTGTDGATGSDGITGSDGATGATGSDGATGEVGPTGLTGATGPTGDQGTPGIQGVTGPSGPQGLAGDAGATGGTGATGLAGTNGLAEYGYVYNLSLQTVEIGADVTFDSNGLLSSGITHAAGDAGITVVNAGIYKVTFSASGTGPHQMALFLNGGTGAVLVPGTVYGSGAGTQQNTGQAIFNVGAGNVLTLRNHITTAAIGLATVIGGTGPSVNASIVIEKLA